MRRTSPRVDWFDAIQNYYETRTILALHPELNCWLIRWDGGNGLTWMELNEASDSVQPFHLETQYGKQSARDAYHLHMLHQSQQKNRLVCGELFGFKDVFYPLSADPANRTFLYAGQFLTKPLDWERCATVWQELTGQQPASTNPDFVALVRAALRVPVFDERMLEGLETFFELLASFMTGQAESTLHERAYHLKNEVFSKYWPNVKWIDRAIRAEEFHLTPWYYEGEFCDWMKAEMQMSRLPTTVLTLVPLYSRANAVDPVKRRVQDYRLQHACIAHTMDMPETAASRLEDYGVVFVTSPAPSKSQAKARLELKERGEALRSFVRKELDLDCVVGIGRPVPEGESLHASYRESVLALHSGVQGGVAVTFFRPELLPEHALSFRDLKNAVRQLSEAFASDTMEPVTVAADHYVRLVLSYADERIEVVRSQFLVAIFELLEGIQKRHVVRQAVVDQVAAELTQRLESSHSLYQLMQSFQECVGRLWHFASQALEGPKSMRLATTLQFLKDNFHEQLKLSDVARKAGFSVPAFSRVFRQATGTSFLSHVRVLRVDHAKRLLRTTSLSVEQVAHASGFQSQHHLIRSFKKVTRQTPGTYRREARANAA